MSANHLLQQQMEDEYVGKWIQFLRDGKLPADQEVAKNMIKEQENFVVGDVRKIAFRHYVFTQLR